jgi:DsbC/DsbD-like thiol-disulfide interchange protein
MANIGSNRAARRRFIVAGCMLMAAAWSVFGQIPKEPIKWSIKANLPGKPLKPGDQFSVLATAAIDNGWHLYATDQPEGGPTPTRISMPGDQPFAQDGAIQSAEPKMIMDPNFNMMTHYYEEQAEFLIPVKVAPNAPAGKSEVRVNAFFQTCNDEICLPPKTVKLVVEVMLAAR